MGRLSRSGGIFDAPGGSYACVILPLIDVAEIAQEILRKCVNEEYGLMGGWRVRWLLYRIFHGNGTIRKTPLEL